MIDFYLQPLALGETISTLEIPCIYLFLIYIIYNIYFFNIPYKGNQVPHLQYHTSSLQPHKQGYFESLEGNQNNAWHLHCPRLREKVTVGATVIYCCSMRMITPPWWHTVTWRHYSQKLQAEAPSPLPLVVCQHGGSLILDDCEVCHYENNYFTTIYFHHSLFPLPASLGSSPPPYPPNFMLLYLL